MLLRRRTILPRLHVRHLHEAPPAPWMPLVWLSAFAVGASAIEHDYIEAPTCGFRKHFGVPCPGCGGTRATLAFFDGRWFDSMTYNPLVAGIMGLWAFYIIEYVIVRVARRRLVVRWFRLPTLPAFTAWLALLCGNWALVLYLSRSW